MSAHVPEHCATRVSSSLKSNPSITSQLVFSPRPVLVEGVHDVAALSVALERTHSSEVVAQTDLIDCGGSGAVALWFSIAKSLELDVKAVADLDALLAPEVQKAFDSDQEICRRHRTEFGIEPPRTSAILSPLITAMNGDSVPKNPKERAKWIARTIPEENGWSARARRMIEIWRDAGLWLHPQGTLEDVLGLEEKGQEVAQRAAAVPGPIDAVARWSAFTLDPMGDVEILLGVAVERIAHAINEALRTDPEAQFHAPVGPASASDARLVSVEPTEIGRHRITVRQPIEFAGYWLEFSRSTPSDQLQLNKPAST